MKTIVVFLLLLGSVLNTCSYGLAQSRQPPPRQIDLEAIASAMLSREITREDEEALVAAITRVAIRSTRSKTDQYVGWNGALWKVLENAFPEVKTRTDDQGLSLVNVMRYFHSLPAFRRVVDDVLQGEKTHGTCAK